MVAFGHKKSTSLSRIIVNLENTRPLKDLDEPRPPAATATNVELYYFEKTKGVETIFSSQNKTDFEASMILDGTHEAGITADCRQGVSTLS